MAQRAVVTVQRGLWIDNRQLAEAGLHDLLEITVQPGEITIRSAEPHQQEGTDELERAYPLSDETFREGWEAPGMEDYDQYEKFRKA